MARKRDVFLEAFKTSKVELLPRLTGQAKVYDLIIILGDHRDRM
jgi:hypothetical protein